MLALAWGLLSGCSSEPAASASEEKLTAEQTEAALKRKGYQGTPSPRKTELPRENGQPVPAVDTQTPPGVPYPDYLEKKSGFTHETTYSTPGLSNGTYNISSVTVSDEKYYHVIQNRTWEVYVTPRQPDPAPYYPPSNPDNDDWNAPSTPPSYDPVPSNPDNDDWSAPSTPPSYDPAPSNPDNDDWSGSLLNLGLFGSSTAEAADPLTTALLVAQCAQYDNFGYYQIGSTTYLHCGPVEYMEYTRTPVYDDIRRSSVSVDFQVNGSGGTTSCNLTAPSRLRSDRWVYDTSGVSVNCDADWAETKTDEKGKPVSAARTYANDLSQLIQGGSTAPVK